MSVSSETTPGMRQGGLRTVLRDAWALARPFFTSEEKWRAIGLLVLIIGMNLTQVALTVLLNSWRGQFYDALQEKDFAGFTALILFYRNDEAHGFMPGFTPIVAVLIPIAIYAIYLTQMLQLRWRTWMTRRVLGQWLAQRAYYTIGLQNAGEVRTGSGVAKPTDNPDQRISEDINSFTSVSLTFSLDLLSTVVSLASFAQILWTLSGTIEVWGVAIPGYMLWIAMAYAVIGTWLTHRVGRPLAALDFRRQKSEADFRFNLVRVRENAEGVALYGGEESEKRGLLGRFATVVEVTLGTMSRKKKLNALTTGYGQVAAIFPIVIAAPRYFAGQLALGGLMRIAGAFAQVQSALSWFVDNYAQLAAWKATVDRLTMFNHAIADAQALASGGVRVAEGGVALALEDARIALPDGRLLLAGSGTVLPPGESRVVSGRSGSGKSTLFRAVAGIWPFGGGAVRRPVGRTLFLPQRPYLPLGTLRQVVSYPEPVDSMAPGAAEEALGAVGLGALVPELDAEEPWSQRLSGGEQQRLAVARALLVRPDWLYLDEATASLDPEAEAEMYRLLRERLPDTTILSIAHRDEVAQWHDGRLTLRDGVLTEGKA